MKTFLLGDVSVEKFLSEYWQKKPLLIRQALPGCVPPIQPGELAGLACEEQVESRLVIHDGSGDKWEMTHGPFTEETFRTLPKRHWTLLVQAVDHWVPEAGVFLDQFSFIPSWRVDDLMISLAGDQSGVGPHYDNYDVFLVQVEGRRRWEVGGHFNEQSPRRPDTPVMILTDWRPEESWVLEPGDMLYVPPRVGHNGMAVGEACMTCSVGFRAPSHADILREFTDFVGSTLSEEIRYADPDLVPQPSPGQITPEALKQVRQILRQYIEEDEKVAEWFGCSVTTPKYSDDDSSEQPYGLDDLRNYLTSGGMLRRNEGSRFAYQEQGDEIWLFVDGHCYRCPSSQLELVRALCDKREISNGREFLRKNTLPLVLDLLNQGSLYFPE